MAFLVADRQLSLVVVMALTCVRFTCMQLVNRWLSIRLELMGSFIVFTAAVLVAVVLPVDAGLAGLALTSALNLTGGVPAVACLVLMPLCPIDVLGGLNYLQASAGGWCSAFYIIYGGWQR